MNRCFSRGSCKTHSDPWWHGHPARVYWAMRPSHERFCKNLSILYFLIVFACVFPAAAQTTLSITRTVEGDAFYAPGGAVDLTVTFFKDGPDPVTQLGLKEWIPEGWTFDSVVEGEAPTIVPASGAADVLDFAYLFPPAVFPVSFTYRLNVPGDAAGSVTIEGYGIYATNGTQEYSETVYTDISPIGGEGEGLSLIHI